MNIVSDPINDIAKRQFGIDYVYPFQRLVISNILRSSSVKGFEIDDNFKNELTPEQIVLLPTGSGKSLCFMIPAFFLKGITLVIFPLLSLMADQLRRTEEAGLETVVLKGGQSLRERKEIFDRCQSGQVKMILSNPETLLNESILVAIKNLTIDHFVIDETHTVSEWGESFRPAYLELYKIISELHIEIITAFTATASPIILKKIKNIIFPDSFPNIIYGNPDRDNISYEVINSSAPTKILIEQIILNEKPLIIFCTSRTSCEITARELRCYLSNNNIYFYHAGLSNEEKEQVEKWFFNSEDGILIATCAYGMGIDKKDIRSVIHIDLPPTVEAYLQESGRAGRDKRPSNAIIIYNDNKIEKQLSISDSVSSSRFLDIVNYAKNNNVCRRETLLFLLASEPEICNGCDVCNENIFIDEYKEIVLKIIKKNKRRFSKREFIYFLKGYKNADLKDLQYVYIQGFGILSYWETDLIREMIESLLKLKIIYTYPTGFWKNKLTIINKLKK